MKLQTKLLSAFGVLAAITLAVALMAFWEVQRLGSSLYEVGVVRLPSIQGLGMMSGAVTELGDSARRLLAGNEAALVAQEQDRQQRAWRRFVEGWTLYEPLPQTDEEAVIWQAFVPLAKEWRTEYAAVIAAGEAAVRAGDPALLAGARQRLAAADQGLLLRTTGRLDELTRLNYRVAEAAKRQSVASYDDMVRIRDLMLLAAIVSLVSAIAFGVIVGRRLSRPVVEMAEVISKVAAGDRTVQVEIRSTDETAQMGRAINHMVEALRSSEMRLRLVGDNLPDSMVYQVMRQPNGTMRFLYVSAGIERLHGIPAEAVLRDPQALYSQVLPDDRAVLTAAEENSYASLGVFKAVVRVRRADGSVRWMDIASQPRRHPDGNIVWDGIETDITERKRGEEELKRINRALRTLSRCNHVLVHATAEAGLLDDICRMIVEEGGHYLARISFAQNDERKTVRIVARAGGGDGSLEKLDITWADEPKGHGPTGTAIRTGEPVISHDFHLDPTIDPWRLEAKRHGVQSSVVYPLRVDGVVIGALSIYSCDAAAFEAQEFELLAELAEDTAFGLRSLRTQGERNRLAQVIDAHRDAAFWLDTDSRIIYANPACCQSVGYGKAELIGKPLVLIAPGATPTRLAEVWARVRADGVLRTEGMHRRKDGTTFAVEVSATRTLIDGRELCCAFVRDITKRKQAETALRDSEERFRSAMNHSGVGMAIVAPSGRWLEVNPTLCRITGYTRDEMLATDFQSITHPEDLERDVRLGRELLDGDGTTFEVEKRYLHKTGRIVWIQLNVSLVRDAAGAPVCLISQMQDITARKQAEASLAAAAERLALALQASRFGVWRHNLQTRETEWDVRMFEIFGLPVSPVMPSPEQILACVLDEDRATVRRSWNALPSCDHAYHLRFRVAQAGGKIRHIELQGTVHDDALGCAEWTIGVAGDITDIMQTAAESERLRAQLQQAQKMETLGKLAAGVAHDFNNLLTGINGFVDLASKTLGPGHEAIELLKQARQGAMSARDLVRRILNFSRSNQDQKRGRLDAVAVVRDTAPLIAAALPGNLSLALAIDCTTAPVLGDAGQLQQLLMNLCINAAHASGPAPGKIEVGVQARVLGSTDNPGIPRGCVAGLYVRLSVRDHGCGMDEATQKRIFEPFFTTRKQGEGTGLGLAIVQDVVTAHEGGLELSSAPGAGTKFAIYLPWAETAPAPWRAPEPPPANVAGQKILVVDDDVSVAKVVQLALRRNGFQPEVFSSSVAAWKRFEAGAQEFELLIVDQNMPELSGADFASRARTLVPTLPIMMMSGRFEPLVASAFLKNTRVAPLKKPFEIDDLIGAVRAALGRTEA